MSKVEPWMTVYPTLADVQIAGLSTLNSWDEHLPAPQTDVEVTIRKRIKRRMWDEARTKEPELMQRVEDLFARAEKLMGMKPGTLNPGNKD